MGTICISRLGKAYKYYRSRWGRLAEWLFSDQKNPLHSMKWVLRDINLDIKSGESVGIVGANGAGKSTLLKMITGTTQPTEGGVEIRGRVAALLELGMGFHPEFTGRQNAFMAGQLQGLGVIELTGLMPDIEKFADIGDYIDQPVRIYSSGMQLRLAFAVATACRPDILIVDEALSVGDAAFQAKCYQRIAEYKKQGTTLLLVSHSPSDIVKHCDRAILLKNGSVAYDGAARVVTNRYLDELFGKRSSNEDLPVSLCQLMSEGALDAFHTHPGYHSGEHRWGHGGASIVDYLVVTDGQHYPSQIEGNAQANFYFKVHFKASFENVVPGFLIKTLEGIFLYGTNSFISTQGKKQISAHAGEVKIFQFSLPMSLNEGSYLVSFGISSGDPLAELVPLDRRYDSVLIHVGRAMQFWGIVDMQASFNCLGENAGDFVND